MHQQEVEDLKILYPLLNAVLRMIGEGQVINKDNPFWPAYLIARQRGLVRRTGEDGRTIAVSPRGKHIKNCPENNWVTQ